MAELKEEIRAKIKEIIKNESKYVRIWLYIFLPLLELIDHDLFHPLRLFKNFNMLFTKFLCMEFCYNIFNFIVVVMSLVLIKNAFGIIKTKQHKKKKI